MERALCFVLYFFSAFSILVLSYTNFISDFFSKRDHKIMMCNTVKERVSESQSLYTTSLHLPKKQINNVWKSDIYLVPPNELTNLTGGRDIFLAISNNVTKSPGDYYKKYEHDEIPVKESNKNSESGNDEGQEEKVEIELTSTELDILETTDNKKTSQELNTASSFTSLESNIKFFKTTVQQIFDNFYSTMQDFELYKQKFQLILQKNRAESIAEMEDFIKDMIQHIMSSESVSNGSRISSVTSDKKDDDIVSGNGETQSQGLTFSEGTTENLGSIIEAYKNDDYLTDSVTDEKSMPTKGTQETLNIYLLGHAPLVEIKMNDRQQLSEINIKGSKHKDVKKQVASAEDLKKLAAKRKEVERYIRQIQENKENDREIPVKISSPKKNIHLNEDFSVDKEKPNKSILVKLCNYLCKRFRKNY